MTILSQDVTECHRMSQDVTECHRMSQDVTECHRMSQNVTGSHRMSQDNIRELLREESDQSEIRSQLSLQLSNLGQVMKNFD